jgi:hypothetical protein
MAGKSAAAGTRAAGKAAAAAKVPLIAGGAALAGIAGGVALVRRRMSASSDGGFSLDNAISGLQRVGSYGEQLGALASALQSSVESGKKSD